MTAHRDPPKRKLQCVNCAELYLGVQREDAHDGYGVCPPCEEEVRKYVEERDKDKPTTHEVALARQTLESAARQDLMKKAIEGVDWLIRKCHKTAKEHGWWDKYDELDASNTLIRLFEDDVVASKLALIHSEVSEALEELRKGTVNSWLYYKHSKEGEDKPEGVAAELADVLVRIFDLCGRYDIPLSQALMEKMAYNEKRPYRHGGKKL